MARFWTDEATAEVWGLYSQGVAPMEIANRMGRTSDSVRQKIKYLRANGYCPPTSPNETESPAEELQAMAKAAGAVRQPQAPVVKSSWIDDEPMQDIWARHEQTNAKKILKAKELNQFSVDLPADEPIALAFVSDQHISPGTPVDLARMRADAEYIRDTTNLYALLGGDGVDNHCLSADTEVLTMRGWLSYDQLEGSDRVYGINTITGLGEWQEVRRVVVRHNYKGDLIYTKTESLDLLCTTEHRVLCRTGETRDTISPTYGYERRLEMRSRRWIPVAADMGLPDWGGASDAEIAIVGWVLTDGWIQTKRGINRYFIGQRESNSEEVRIALGAAGFVFSESHRSVEQQNRGNSSYDGRPIIATEGLITFCIRQPHNRRLQQLLPEKPDIPYWVYRLSARQFRVFLDAVVEGDGSYNGRSRIIYGKQRFLEQLQIACVTHGLSAKLRRVPGRSEVRLLVNPKSDEQLQFPTHHQIRESHSSTVWCLQTPLENFMVRRDGKPHITGNCKHRAAMLAMRSTASDQYRMFEYYLSIFAPKVLALCSGNHEGFTKWAAGVDVLDYISERQRLCYSPHGFTIRVTVCGQEYVVCLRHQYKMNSTLNQTHAPKQLWRFGETDFDVGVVCHHHEAASETCVFRGLDRFVARPGSYQITSSYSEQYGYNSTYPTCPTVILFPRSRRLVGFHDMRMAGQFLRGMLR